MSYYLRRGAIPHKRHTQFRRADGELHHEEVMGIHGFAGIQSILYHLRPPTQIRQVETLANTARLTMLGEVASTLAHELNQPLTAIASYNAGIANSLAKLGVQDELVCGALKRLGQRAGAP